MRDVRFPSPLACSILLVAAPLVAACNDDGRTLAPAPEIPVAPPTAVPSPDTAAEAMALEAPAAVEGVRFAPDHTCDRRDVGVIDANEPGVSPPLVFAAVPAATQELALVMSDRDAGGLLHWVLAGIPPGTRSLAAGEVPAGAVLATNFAGEAAYRGPCPPEGEVHTYVLRLLALAEPVGLQPGLDGERAFELLAQAPLAQATIELTYARTPTEE